MHYFEKCNPLFEKILQTIKKGQKTCFSTYRLV